MNYNINVTWTGSYPTLCCGRWIITIDGISLTGLESDSFETKKSCSTWKWNFEKEDPIEWNESQFGLSLEEWIVKVKEEDLNNLYSSLKRYGFNIEDKTLFEEIFHLIQEEDFVAGSCGGCT